MHAVDFVFVLALLGDDAATGGQKRFQFGFRLRTLTLDVPEHPPQNGLQLPRAPCRPLDPAVMGIAALLADQLPGDAVAVLAQADPPLAGCFHQPLSAPVIEPGVGGKTDGLLMHRGDHFDALKLVARHRLAVELGSNCFSRKILGAFLPDALAPADHAGKMHGQLMLEVMHAAQVLPVKVFHSTAQHLRITQVVGGLEVVPSHHKAGADGQTPLVGTEALHKYRFHPLPVHYPGEFHQRMDGIDDL